MNISGNGVDQCSQNNGCCGSGTTCFPADNGKAECICADGYDSLVNGNLQCIKGGSICSDAQFTCGDGQ